MKLKTVIKIEQKQTGNFVLNNQRKTFKLLQKSSEIKGLLIGTSELG